MEKNNYDGRIEYETTCERCGETLSCEEACACGVKLLGVAAQTPIRGLPKNKYHNIVKDDMKYRGEVSVGPAKDYSELEEFNVREEE